MSRKVTTDSLMPLTCPSPKPIRYGRHCKPRRNDGVFRDVFSQRQLDEGLAMVLISPACGLLLALSSQSVSLEELKTCTLIGCVDAVLFALLGMPDDLPNGVYRASAAVNGAEVSCEATNLEPGVPVLCSSQGSSPGIELELGQQGRSIRLVGSASRHIRLQLLRDGNVLASYEGDPGPYRVLQPNGAGCPPVCLQAGPFPLRVE